MNPRPFWNPYVAGVALGVVLLSSFLLMGWGLGSSGAVTRLGVGAAHLVAPETVESNEYFARYFGGGALLDNWLVYLVLGVFLGGLVGAYTGGRLRSEVIRGAANRVSPGTRIALALLGGAMLAVFAGGYLLAPLVRRQWR